MLETDWHSQWHTVTFMERGEIVSTRSRLPEDTSVDLAPVPVIWPRVSQLLS